ncbi:MAG: nucleotide pyrophosphohydrolase [Archaeoglobaceae archaeon]|nr:nucleotide pyrophosphohydrolase [Archaeoglobaceae archaeon]MCX8152505.1 nucleotide pyrophosphohydrolase [Archaeoglobaceae archaeon]MDW8013617.1 MazG nucleotide pyrophosphohydrolase domain-containing protein [Archaeoglobaceae archaeon]
MDFKIIVEKVREKYGEIDKKSGHLFLLSVLFEEIGELAEAVRKQDVNKIAEELADSLFMLISLANYFDVDPIPILVSKFIEKDVSSEWDLPSS